MYSKSARDAWADTLQLPAEVNADIRRDFRRRYRVIKRQEKHTAYQTAGLNGPRAVARRLAAIERTGHLACGAVAFGALDDVLVVA